jgi:hypothetical protein
MAATTVKAMIRSIFRICSEDRQLSSVSLFLHLKASSEPGRIALLCRVVSLGQFSAFIATHLGADLVERHRAEHRYSLAEHLERHPDRSLAALASDPRITFGLKPQAGKWCGCLPSAHQSATKSRYGLGSEPARALPVEGVDKSAGDSFPLRLIFHRHLIGLNVLALAKCKTANSEHHQDDSGYHQPMRILHR